MINKIHNLSLNPPGWSKIRIALLSLSLIGFFGVFLQLILSPAQEKKSLHKDLVFPDTVPLSGWKLQETTKLNKVESSRFGTGEAPGHLYKYANNKDSLEVEGRYVEYVGNINRYIIIYRNMEVASIQLQTKHIKNVGYYGLFEHENKAYLSACVNPKGETTATETQFTNNRYTHGWGLQRTFLWVIGQQDLLDARCLWTIMSVPITDYDPYKLLLEKDLADEHQKLEKAFVDWQQWWKGKFPSF
ncbi:cyanoexosortase A system-associated protein [Gloeothece verrucosa]|uniref:Cyanoexosortase A system-associated protein n=1 Tax=Gloeothece verrucosa (strain PCC 7822) TaxID=497965 RepID=E0U5S1_GLOV7|nr:cyanoexosortase A system-associated protein [Gloeothece verrucosa]ADN15912.1 conserved hypothetical protein [Gloeothece verrucosa PCC 7822]